MTRAAYVPPSPRPLPEGTSETCRIGCAFLSGDGSLTDAQRSRPVSSERTQLVELRALGSTGSSAGGALGEGPEPDELADFGSVVIPGRRTSRPRGLFVADGGSHALKDPAVPCGLLRRAGRLGVLLPVEGGPGFPWGSLVFLFVPLRPLSRLL